MSDPVHVGRNHSQGADPWVSLRRFTEARIALGRVGGSLPTAEVLSFSLAHARARDAVHLPLDTEAVAASFDRAGFAVLRARSQAATRQEYLSRRDLGRRLDPDCVASLRENGAPPPQRLTFIVADGLSSLAITRHALPLIQELRSRISGWAIDAVVIATQARVALGDEIGSLRRAAAVVVFIGERPGLSSPDSLGIYMTYAPRPGRSDAERNCISNVREAGLTYPDAAARLGRLLQQARLAGGSGTAIKDRSEASGAPRLLP